ncbi:MAG: hypothetical protein AAGF84_08150 [Planctomycetota bacterium]
MKNAMSLVFSLLAATVVATGLGCEEAGPTSTSTSAMSRDTASEEAEIRGVFEAYRQAVLDRDGLTAVGLVSQSTLTYYDRGVDWILHADEAETKALSLLDRFLVVITRHRIPADELRTMTGRDLCVVGVDRGWTSDESTSAMRMGDLKVFNRSAKGTLVTNEGRAPDLVQFDLEAGSWKLDLIPMLRVAEPGMKQIIEQTGMTENEFLFFAAGMDSGGTPTSAIWQPIVAPATEAP